jgi:hypothetical protein
MKRGTVFILGLSTLSVLTGCEYPEERRVVVSQPAPVVRERVRAPVVVTQAPPPPIEEAIPPSPGARYVWAPGYWVWNGRWLWQSGRWTLPPRERAVWQPGRWEEHRGEWMWEPGRWR